MRRFIHRMSPLWSGSRVDRRETACQERGLLAGGCSRSGAHNTAAACLAKAHSVLRNTTASRRRRRAPYTTLSFSELGAGLLDYAAVVGCIAIVVMIGMTVVGHRTADWYCDDGAALKAAGTGQSDGDWRKAYYDPKLKCCVYKQKGGLGNVPTCLE